VAGAKFVAVWSESIRAFCSPLGMPAVNPIHSRHLIPFDLASEREHVTSFRTEFDVMPVYRALNSTGLVGALEMPREPIAILI
jgi:hypothetical protein